MVKHRNIHLPGESQQSVSVVSLSFDSTRNALCIFRKSTVSSKCMQFFLLLLPIWLTQLYMQNYILSGSISNLEMVLTIQNDGHKSRTNGVPFNIRDLIIHRCWYLWHGETISYNQSHTNTQKWPYHLILRLKEKTEG